MAKTTGNSNVLSFHKDTFENTSEDRRQRIIDQAIKAFAQKGYNATSINEIARESGICIGSIYSYFASKEDLYLSIANKGFQVLKDIFESMDSERGDIYTIFEKLLRSSKEYAEKHHELCQIYLDITTQGLSNLSQRLSNQMENISIRFYEEILQKARSEGRIDPAVDIRAAAFFFDNLLLMFLFSFTSSYYKERMKLFLGEDALENPDKMIGHFVTMIQKALS